MMTKSEAHFKKPISITILGIICIIISFSIIILCIPGYLVLVVGAALNVPEFTNIIKQYNIYDIINAVFTLFLIAPIIFISGIGILLGRGWARKIVIGVASISILFNALAILTGRIHLEFIALVSTGINVFIDILLLFYLNKKTLKEYFKNKDKARIELSSKSKIYKHTTFAAKMLNLGIIIIALGLIFWGIFNVSWMGNYLFELFSGKRFLHSIGWVKLTKCILFFTVHLFYGVLGLALLRNKIWARKAGLWLFVFLLFFKLLSIGIGLFFDPKVADEFLSHIGIRYHYVWTPFKDSFIIPYYLFAILVLLMKVKEQKKLFPPEISS